MSLTHFFNLHKKINKFDLLILFEISVIFVISILLGYFINGNLNFLKSNEFNFLYILILIIALFYGIIASIILDIMYIVFAYVYFNIFPFDFSINTLMIAIIGGEFNFYWKLKILNLETQIDYLNSKLREIGRGALFTKLSHDYLEESYLSKPYSLRGIILEVSKMQDIESFLMFLNKKFHIFKFAYIENKKVYPFNMEEDVNFDDLLIEKMYEKKDIVYFKDTKSKYLASIPIFDTKDNIKAFILIKEIPFIYYSEENLLSIQLSANYFYLKMKEFIEIEKLKKDKFCNFISCESLREIKRLFYLYKTTNAKSSLVLFEVNKEKSSIASNFFTKSLRVLDFFEKIEKKNIDLFIVCLPLTNKIGANFFVERVLNTVKLNKNNIYNIFEINEYKSILKIINE